MTILKFNFKTISFIFSSFFILVHLNLVGQTQPNILLIISDDLGVDASNGYHAINSTLTTPNLDNLRNSGITFENAWASPVCSPTRSNIISGKYGTKTGVLGVPGILSTDHTSIFKAVEALTNGAYADAVFGKWHLGPNNNRDHPADHGVDYFGGSFGGAVQDYFDWAKTTNGVMSNVTEYATTHFTNDAINWINSQNQPWLVSMSYTAPHTPLHVPPESMYTINNTGNNYRKYLAMIESLDFEIGRLLDNIPTDVLDNTIIIYIGDNGTPSSLLQDYPDGHGKGFLYQGGVRVPMIVAGAGVTRQGEREPALVHATDIHATILELVGADLPGGIYNSLSFKHLLDNQAGDTRTYNYGEVTMNGNQSWTIRNDEYKLINFVDSTQEFYNLLEDSLEFNDLMLGTLTDEQSIIKSELETEAAQIRTAWSCNDFIQNGDETGIDCGGTYCSPCITAVDVLEDNNLQIRPNPTNAVFEIEGLVGDNTIQILGTKGRIYHTYQNTSSSLSIDISNLPAGLFLIKILNNTDNKIQIEKILKSN